jgi:lambda repressor-like predicted transcriptional regulator
MPAAFSQKSFKINYLHKYLQQLERFEGGGKMRTSELNIDRERHLEIKYQLGLRSVTFSDLAQRLGLKAVSSVSQVSLGRQRSQRVEKLIAETLEVPVQELFPERYAPDPKEDTT